MFVVSDLLAFCRSVVCITTFFRSKCAIASGFFGSIFISVCSLLIFPSACFVCSVLFLFRFQHHVVFFPSLFCCLAVSSN